MIADGAFGVSNAMGMLENFPRHAPNFKREKMDVEFYVGVAADVRRRIVFVGRPNPPPHVGGYES